MLHIFARLSIAFLLLCALPAQAQNVTGTGKTVLQTAPTIAGPTVTGTMTGATANFSGAITASNLTPSGTLTNGLPCVYASTPAINCNAGLTVAQGGTGVVTSTAYSVVFTGTTATGAFQAAAGPGTSRHVLTSNGAAALPTFQANGWLGTTVKSTSNESGTFTTSANTRVVHVRLVAGGGGGAGVDGAANASAGAGGAAGGYAEKWCTVTPSTGYAYTVGILGAAGATDGGTGGTGGDSIFDCGGTTVTAKGGVGAAPIATGTSTVMGLGGASGGISTNGDVNGAGAPGGWALRVSGSVAISGQGASSQWGSGGSARITSGAGNAGTGYGAGGGGANTISAQGDFAGGAGTQGLIIIEEYTH